MKDTADSDDSTASPSTVYGPVLSWRLGWSLGIDLIQDISTCSFNCVYCQLGAVRRKTTERRVYVPTERVLNDLETTDWSKVDAITLSGCGEPCLALNLGEVLRELRARYAKPTVVLTNSFHFHDPAVRSELGQASEVVAKLDAGTTETLRRFNRPVEPVTIEWIVEGIEMFRRKFPGRLSIQTMLMPANAQEAKTIAEWIGRIHPDEVQLNTPKRFYPLVWRQENRGRHVSEAPEYPHRRLRTIPLAQMEEIAQMMRRVTGIENVVVCGKQPKAP